MSDVPDLGALLTPILQQIPRDRQPLFVALAERLAAARYRAWAEEVPDAATRGALLACAEREVEIAAAVEALQQDAAEAQREILAAHPELEKLNHELFAGRPLAEQWEIQARGERLGAATWRRFAAEAERAARETFERCVQLEEASAEVLDSLLREA